MKNNDAELRLALVCYGGVSLAVYMHGVTKEIHKLLCAARQFDKRLDANPFSAGTEKVYFDALTRTAESGPRLEVSVDIIGGTSAGGINGIALSKAIARNASLEPLKKVWIEEGDIRKLLRGTRLFGLRAQVLTTVVGQLFRMFGASSPLRGEHLSKLLYQALTAMESDRDKSAYSLLPDTAPELELYVPATDLNGYDVLVPSGIGGASNRDRDYRQVLVFSGVGKNPQQFGEQYTADLAFAGRASASFPGAFAPVSQASFKEEIGQDVDLHPQTVFLCQYEPDEADDAYFVDGGVLDNAPFDLVIDAIARRRARTRVYRQLVYIEPDPGQELYSMTHGKPADKGRRWLKDIFFTLSTVRGSHPILVELTKLRDMNWRIAEVKAIAEQQEKYVEKRVRAALSNQLQQSNTEAMTITQLVDEVTAADGTALQAKIEAVSNEVYADARDSLGPAWSTYQRLKFEAVLNRLADEISWCLRYPRPSARAGFVAATWIAWARKHDAWQMGHTRALGNLLRESDMPYRERRFMFILSRINSLYDFDDNGWTPPVGDLDKLKEKAWEMIATVRSVTIDAIGRMEFEGVLNLLRLSDDDVVRLDPEKFAADNREMLQVMFERYADALKPARDDSVKLLEEFRLRTKEWRSDEARNSLLSSYLAFALWDGLLFPTISLSELPQLSPIPVAQFSPLTATALKPPSKEGDPKPTKLKGIPVHHFAAFFAAEARENDYLWGRLDGAELILQMLTDVAKKHAFETIAATGDETLRHLKDALQAVLDEEKGLRRVKTLRADLAKQVEALGQASVSASP
ncbi:patatin-like protein [Mycobacterium sp. ITM-2016-00318]|uniref:patatin-like protein n=1 Tax=Mycobacterium sp. ITM-2016-00318 TaxID=2099693 RepID=UPI0013048A99|nr:patatin-like protein [Mycobacterium sp. ITM-2016-00318]WNG93350.1 patatin-like protein [Mycobacterium sp. ITM-2016-00318]